ncbi:MAG: response regulator [Calditrichaeota bacterium]|nr:response regulator [Calditrichota bacterium]
MIRTIIVDDEPLARKGIRFFLQNQQDFEIIAECEDGLEAIEKIETSKPDLAFLDIQMPEIDGFDVLNNLHPESIPFVVFVTAYDQFALKAFQAHAVDYILKPIHEEQFYKALQRIRLLVKAKDEPQQISNVSTLLKEIQAKPKVIKRFIVREKNKLIIVPVEQVDVLEAKGDYITLKGFDKKYIIRETLINLDRNLDPAHFVRVNRSTILRLTLIKELQPLSKGDHIIKLKNGEEYMLSRNYRDNVFNSLS